MQSDYYKIYWKESSLPTAGETIVNSLKEKPLSRKADREEAFEGLIDEIDGCISNAEERVRDELEEKIEQLEEQRKKLINTKNEYLIELQGLKHNQQVYKTLCKKLGISVACIIWAGLCWAAGYYTVSDGDGSLALKSLYATLIGLTYGVGGVLCVGAGITWFNWLTDKEAV